MLFASYTAFTGGFLFRLPVCILPSSLFYNYLKNSEFEFEFYFFSMSNYPNASWVFDLSFLGTSFSKSKEF